MADAFDLAWDSVDESTSAASADPFDLAWDSVQVEEPARTWGDTAYDAGREFLKSGVGMASMLQNPIDMMIGQMGLPTNATRMEEARKKLVGDPNLEGLPLGERAIIKGAGYIPYGAGGGVFEAIASGVGGQVLKDVGLPEWFGELISGGVAGGARYGAVKAKDTLADTFSFLSESGQKKQAGQVLREALGPDGVKAAIANAVDTPFGTKTLAEVAQTPGVANLEMAIKKDPQLGNEIIGALQERASNRVGKITELLGGEELGSVTKDIRGETIRGLAIPINTSADDLSKAAWKGIDNEAFDASEAMRRTLNMAMELKNPLGYSDDAHKVMNALITKDEAGGVIFPRRLTIDEYQRIRSAAGEVMTEAANKGRNREAALMATVREGLDSSVEAAVKNGDVAGETAESFKKALATTRTVKETFDTGLPGAIVQRGEAGFKTPASQIPNKLIQSPEAAKQFVKAYGKSPELMQEARGALLDEMTKKGPDTWVGFFKEKTPQFKAVFSDDFDSIKAVIDDLASEQSVGKLNQLATGRGSITSQGVTSLKFLEDRLKSTFDNVSNLSTVTGGIIGSSGGGLAAGLGSLAGKAVGNKLERKGAMAAQEIKSLIAKGLRDPQFAKRLLAEPSVKNVNRLAESLSRLATSQSGVLRRESDQKDEKSPGRQGSQDLKFPIGSSSDVAPSKAAIQEKSKDSVKEISTKREIESDPIDAAIFEVESSSGKNLKNPKSSAKGGFQLIDATSKSLGVDDPMDLAQNYAGYKKLKAEHIERFGNDPEVLYAAHFLGATTLDKFLKGKPLTKEQSDHVQEFKKVALPRFRRAYRTKKAKESEALKMAKLLMEAGIA